MSTRTQTGGVRTPATCSMRQTVLMIIKMSMVMEEENDVDGDADSDAGVDS